MAEPISGSVKAKVAAINETNKKMQAGVRAMMTSVSKLVDGIRAQEKENATAAANMHKGVQEVHNKIALFQQEIKEQETVNKAAVREINAGSRKVVTKINNFAAKIQNYQATTMQEYAKNFWG